MVFKHKNNSCINQYKDRSNFYDFCDFIYGLFIFYCDFSLSAHAYRSALESFD